MHLSKEIIEELELLSLFNLDSSLEGIKIHQSQAAPERVAAAKRLFDKRLTTLEDGGYLTTLGVDAAQHVQSLVMILESPVLAEFE